MSTVPVLLLAFSLLIPMAGVARGEGFTFKPRISTTMEYNDNVTETNTPKGDTLFIVKPGLSATYEHSRVFFDLSYDFENKKYLNQAKGDEQNNYLSARGELEAIKDLFFINTSDTYRKVYLNATRGEVEEGDTTVGTTDQNTFDFNPYFVIPLQERTSLKTGVGVKDIWYAEEGSVDKRVYDLYADVNHELSDRWELIGGAKFQKQDPRWQDGGFERYSLKIGTTYTYAEGSFIEASWEPTYTDYKIKDSSNKQYNPYSVGITYAFSPTIVGSASSSMSFSEDPESADTKNKYSHEISLRGDYERGSITAILAYNDYEATDSVSRNTYWRPTIRGTHSLTERLSLNYSAYMNLYTNPDCEKTIFSLIGLSYGLTESTSASLSYRFKMNDEQTDGNDYRSDSIGLTFTWQP
ncbi:TIGR03016 family PEP-CTERM system-associated outer membrane protein [Pseudodesulfovibrio karagichevae]|uniref:TIGR03016 family PEP-CTERM system-associated outer membrane protein n=1 Tax=Pseudodesulfovibrio karagichevae TaxID=3239305 RepID=A0ABV4K4I1_9BACT